jgi:hypothetical protein
MRKPSIRRDAERGGIPVIRMLWALPGPVGAIHLRYASGLGVLDEPLGLPTSAVGSSGCGSGSLNSEEDGLKGVAVPEVPAELVGSPVTESL